MDKDSAIYFMTEMTESEFEEKISNHKVQKFYEFNLIQPERSKREDSSNEEMRCSEHNSNIVREVQ